MLAGYKPGRGVAPGDSSGNVRPSRGSRASHVEWWDEKGATLQDSRPFQAAEAVTSLEMILATWLSGP